VKTFKLAAIAATFAIVLSGSAFADPAATANTSDPGSAPLASPDGGKVTGFSYDVPALANTADPGEAPLMRDARPVSGPLDNAGRANTRDPG
jgi:hypothetical protein